MEKIKVDYLKIYSRVFRDYFKMTPVSSAVSLVYYVISGIFPAFTALTLSKLFDTADKISRKEETGNSLVVYGILYLSVYIFNTFLNFGAGLAMELSADRRNVNYRYILCKKLAELPLISFEDSKIRDMKQRAEDCLYGGQMSGIIRNSFSLIIGCLLNVVTVSAVLAQYSLIFIPLCIISVIPYCAARLIRGKEFYYIKHKLAKKSRRLSYLWNLFNDRRTVKELRTSGADAYIFQKWVECRDETQEEIWSQNRKDALSMLLCDIFKIAGYGACIMLALFLVLNNSVSVGVFGACIAAFLSLQAATRGILIIGGQLPMQIAFAGDFFTFIDLPECDNTETGEDYPGLKEKIELRGINFKYPGAERFAVNNVHLEIKKGEKIAVLGENGSGKTTLSKLIFGLYPCLSGIVEYDGVDLKNYNRRTFYKTISAVSQNFVQYKLPLRENTAMSESESMNDDARINVVLNSAGLSGLLSVVGIDGELGTAFGGGDISGGQWQKLAIARGLFRDSELIIMDEPTSALDPLIETEILEKFMETAHGKTALIISHRVGLCRLVDKIVVMKDGYVVESGSHKELLAKDGEYTRLFRAQEKWYK